MNYAHCTRLLAIKLAATYMLAITASVGWAELTTLVNNGDPSNRVDILFLGDGYTQDNLDAGIYDAHIQSFLDTLFDSAVGQTEPFPRYRNFFNVHKIDVVSLESGADKPSSGIFVDTALNASYDVSGISRLLAVNLTKANEIRDENLASTSITADMQFVTVNDSKYGGLGGPWAVFAGANNSAQEIAVHELGHSFANLADEYVSFPGQSYTGLEPSEVNVTTDPTGSKWAQWLGFDDPRGSTLDIGVFEGGRYYDRDIYRPSSNSKMKTLGQRFNAVSREANILGFYDLVDPLDGWLDNSITLEDDGLWVDVIDPDVILVDWYVDDSLVAENYGEVFQLADFGFTTGTYTVRAHAYDGVLPHAFDGDMLDLVRKDLTELQQEVTWTVTLAAPPPTPGDYNGNGTVDGNDFLIWQLEFGSSGTLADGNADGTVDGEDYTIWRDNFGTISLSVSAQAHTVPEPKSGILFVTGLCVAGWLARQRVDI